MEIAFTKPITLHYNKFTSQLYSNSRSTEFQVGSICDFRIIIEYYSKCNKDLINVNGKLKANYVGLHFTNPAFIQGIINDNKNAKISLKRSCCFFLAFF